MGLANAGYPQSHKKNGAAEATLALSRNRRVKHDGDSWNLILIAVLASFRSFYATLSTSCAGLTRASIV